MLHPTLLACCTQHTHPLDAGIFLNATTQPCQAFRSSVDLPHSTTTCIRSVHDFLLPAQQVYQHIAQLCSHGPGAHHLPLARFSSCRVLQISDLVRECLGQPDAACTISPAPPESCEEDSTSTIIQRCACKVNLRTHDCNPSHTLTTWGAQP